MIHLPHFTFKDRLYKTRIRLISWRGFHKRTDEFKQGEVYLFWIGFILVTIMAAKTAKAYK